MNLHEILLSDFIDCAVDKNYDSLPSPEAWAGLHSEWSQLVGDAENMYLIKLIKEIILLESKITKAAVLLSLIGVVYDEDIVKIINKLGVPVRSYSEETREDDIRFANGYYKQWTLQLEQKRKELESFQKEEGGNITRLYFDQLIIEVSKYCKYQIQENIITAQKFGLLLNQLKKNRERCQMKNG